MTGAAADPLPQAGQSGGQGGELCAELLDLLLPLLAMLEQLKKSSPNADRCGGPARFEIPVGGAPIANSLCLRCKRESGRCQGFSRDRVAACCHAP